MKRLGISYIALGLMLSGVMAYVGAYDSILLVFYRRTEAEVLSYTQDPHGMVREGDWRMGYEFVAGGSATYRGQATFAPKHRPPEGIRKLTVRYLPLAPSVSGVEGNITPTGLVGFVMAAYLMVVGFRASREREKPNQPLLAPS